MDFPQKENYINLTTNKPLIDFKKYYEDTTFVCEAFNIIAIENERYKLPTRNLVSEIWTRSMGFIVPKNELDMWRYSTWIFKRHYKYILDYSDENRKVADKIKKKGKSRGELLKNSYEYVRDKWDTGISGLFFITDRLGELMKEKELTQTEKSIMLCSIYKYQKIDAEVVWVCSDNSHYSPFANFPSLRMFDYSLVYVPEEKLYLDPSDKAAEFGVLSESLSDRFMCRPMDEIDIIDKTPKINKYEAVLVNLDLFLSDENIITGNGTVSFNNQAALVARRVYRTEGINSFKEYINETIFEEIEDAISVVNVYPDSLQTANEFSVDVEIETDKYKSDPGDDFNLQLYVGPTVSEAVLDFNPPRKYPLYFGTKKHFISMINWHLGEGYAPFENENVNIHVKDGLTKYSLISDYNKESNIISIKREYRIHKKMFAETYSRAFERFFDKVKNGDLTSILLEPKAN